MNAKGFRTVAFGLLVAVVPAAVTYLAGVNWESIGVSPQVAAAIGVVIIGLRAITNTSMFAKS